MARRHRRHRGSVESRAYALRVLGLLDQALHWVRVRDVWIERQSVMLAATSR